MLMRFQKSLREIGVVATVRVSQLLRAKGVAVLCKGDKAEASSIMAIMAKEVWAISSNLLESPEENGLK